MKKFYAMKQADGLVLLYRGMGAMQGRSKVNYYGTQYVTFVSYHDGMFEHGYIYNDEVYQLELIGEPT